MRTPPDPLYVGNECDTGCPYFQSNTDREASPITCSKYEKKLSIESWETWRKGPVRLKVCQREFK